MIKETDILIIGGGPAGSTTSLYLSQLGYDITIVEKKKFPRETLCGEFLSREVTEVLKELNIYNEFLSLKPNHLKSFRAIDDSGIELNSDLNFDAYAMKRSVFDSFLLDNAQMQKVKIIQPATVLAISRSKSSFTSEIEDEFGETFQIISKLVIGAYGKQNLLDKKLERNFINKKTFLNGVKFHLPVKLLNECFSDEIRIYTDDGLYCGMNQVNDSDITVCFLENRKVSRIPSRDRLIEAIRSNKNFKSIFSEGVFGYLRTGNIYGTGNIYFGKRDVIENGILMVGDSASVIAPLAGDGIGMAFESAKILFGVLSQYKLNELNIPKIYNTYRKKYQKTFNKRLKTARILQEVILNKKLRKIGFNLIGHYPSLLPYMIKFTRSTKNV